MKSDSSDRYSWWNKSSVTNIVAAAVIGGGLLLPEPFRRPVSYMGLFALSGAVTNWLAIHMLFEKVPGLYGSGVIPARFEDIKREIHRLIMEQFFSPEQFKSFFAARKDAESESRFDFDPIIEEADVAPLFDAFVNVVETSSLGGLLGMFGGKAALDPLREPFSVRMKEAFKSLAQDSAFQDVIRAQLTSDAALEEMNARIEALVEKRLDELTPQQVKEIMQHMIRNHLGWLVVWGGVFGGLMGLLTSLLPFL